MADNMLSARPEYGRTFNTSMWVIGLLAAIQLFAVAWAIFTRETLPVSQVAVVPPTTATGPVFRTPEPTVIDNSAVDAPREQEALTPENVTVPPVNVGVVTGETGSPQSLNPVLRPQEPISVTPTETVPPQPSVSVLPAPSLTGPANAEPLAEALADAAGSVEEISDPLLNRLVSTGEELRSSGNMQGALKALREAEAELPEHPRVLSSLAGTYSQMGLDEKAMGYWERVFELGPEKSGDYYRLAELSLRGEQATASGATTDILKIREVSVNEQPDSKEGQWVSLNITVEGDSSVQPTGADMSLLVYFYDKVDGRKIETSTADTSFEYPSIPYDWQEAGVEEIKVIYVQPEFTEEQKRELGERVYHGFVAELYYRDKLQDTISRPPELSTIRMEEMEQEKIKEVIPQPAVIGPDNSLFPR